MNRIICFLFFLLCMHTLPSCTTFHYKSGNVRSFKPPKDLQNIYGEKFQMKNFDVESFENNIDQNSDRLIGEYLTPNSLKELSKKYDKFIVLYWNPSCSSSNKIYSFAQKLHSQNSLVILASVNYAYPSISLLIKNTYLEKKPVYVLSCESNNTRIIALKKVAFAKEICPKCYETEKDNLMFYKGILFRNDTFNLLRQIDEEEIINSLK